MSMILLIPFLFRYHFFQLLPIFEFPTGIHSCHPDVPQQAKSDTFGIRQENKCTGYVRQTSVKACEIAMV